MKKKFDIVKFDLDSTKIQKEGTYYKIKISNGIKNTTNIMVNMKKCNLPTYVPKNVFEYFNDENEQKNIFFYENDNGIENINNNCTIEDFKNGKSKYKISDGYVYFYSLNNLNPENNKYHFVIFTANDITDEKFTFGLNWLDYVTNRVDEKIIENAGESIDEWLNENNMLEGKDVIDIGCGSGLSSLCFIRRKVKSLTSVDIDNNCIVATNKLFNIYSDGIPENMNLVNGSILDDELCENLGTFDIVYSWGVLHHTGNMWKAIENTIKLVKPNGYLCIALYSNVKRYADDLKAKELYNSANKQGKINYIADYVCTVKNQLIKSKQDPDNWNMIKNRGMNVYNDIVDWLGGIPYEVTTTTIIKDFCEKRGFKMIKCLDPPNKACHEWLFKLE